MIIPEQVHLLPPPIPPPSKRVILTDQDGLFRIIGVAYAQPVDLLRIPYYDTEELTEFSLIKVTDRSYVYREIVPPITGRLGEFHPQQI